MSSIWSETCRIPPRESLPGNLETEIAVIGAGMAGILIADALQGAGRRVVVLEARRMGSGQTGNTTAKITSQHGLLYAELVRLSGERKARQYAEANEAAVGACRRLIAERGIDCDFEEQNAYLYGDDPAVLRAEARAAAALGLPARFVEETSLPFPAAGAVQFTGQAQFHPLKFLSGVARGLTVYEDTTVLKVEDNEIITDRGTVRADKVVFACHFPFVNFPGLYFARMHQERSYVLALENAPMMEGMWIGAEQYSWSFRTYGGLLLLGGAGHRTGENRMGNRYGALRRKAGAWFPGSREVGCWSAQDCVTADSIPYIGRYADSRPDWYVATGFRKWGMTSSMTAAMVLRDLIVEGESPWGEVFDPGRFDLSSVAGTAAEGGQAVKGLTKRLFQIPDALARDLREGEGGVVFWKGEKVGVYRDRDGKLYPVDLRCPHLGCQLEWNPDELSWDCPCHGSRFDRYGELISGPAQTGLNEK